MSAGHNVEEWGGVPGLPANVDVALDIDRAAFADLMIEAVASDR